MSGNGLAAAEWDGDDKYERIDAFSEEAWGVGVGQALVHLLAVSGHILGHLSDSMVAERNSTAHRHHRGRGNMGCGTA